MCAASASTIAELSRVELESILQKCDGMRIAVHGIALRRAEKRLGAMTESSLNPTAYRNVHFLVMKHYSSLV
jgi:hypothetical protein